MAGLRDGRVIVSLFGLGDTDLDGELQKAAAKIRAATGAVLVCSL